MDSKRWSRIFQFTCWAMDKTPTFPSWKGGKKKKEKRNITYTKKRVITKRRKTKKNIYRFRRNETKHKEKTPDVNLLIYWSFFFLNNCIITPKKKGVKSKNKEKNKEKKKGCVIIFLLSPPPWSCRKCLPIARWTSVHSYWTELSMTYFLLVRRNLWGNHWLYLQDKKYIYIKDLFVYFGSSALRVDEKKLSKWRSSEAGGSLGRRGRLFFIFLFFF